METSGNQVQTEVPRRRGGWTLGALTLGLAVVAVCLLVPQIEENRGLRAELTELQAQQARLDEQVRVNDVFLEKVVSDPTLITRLAQRQLRLTPEGTDTLDLPGLGGGAGGYDARSPFQLVSVPPPDIRPPLPAPLGGALMDWARDGRTRLYVLAGAFFLVALGLILDGPIKPTHTTAQPITEVDGGPTTAPDKPDAGAEAVAMTEDSTTANSETDSNAVSSDSVDSEEDSETEALDSDEDETEVADEAADEDEVVAEDAAEDAAEDSSEDPDPTAVNDADEDSDDKFDRPPTVAAA